MSLKLSMYAYFQQIGNNIIVVPVPVAVAEGKNETSVQISILAKCDVVIQCVLICRIVCMCLFHWIKSYFQENICLWDFLKI